MAGTATVRTFRAAPSAISSSESARKSATITRLARWLGLDSDRRSGRRESGEGLFAFYWEGALLPVGIE